MNKDLPQFAVAALVFIARGDELLLVRQSYGKRYWSLPGGSMEHGESVAQAAVREAKEETGLDVRLTRLVGVYSKPAQNALALCFEAEVVGGSIQDATDAALGTRDEIVECGYFHPDALPAPIRAHLRERIAHWQQGQERAVWRSQ
jgi:ADP-ribose pyrophosphatase YjhB (NUDIX family)